MSKHEDVSDLTGENQYRRPPKSLALNEVRFNGQKGKFSYVDIINRKQGEKPVVTDLGSSIQVVFLKIRRRIGGYNKSLKMFYQSTEHNDKNDTVFLFGAKEKGRAEDLYDKFKPTLKAQRVVYAFLIQEGKDRELVRVVVKGSALNPDRDGKKEGTVDLLSYISDKPKGEHTYMFVTNLEAVEETSPLGSYFTINFTRGARLPEDKLNIVIEKIKELAIMSKEQDDYYKDATNPDPSESLPVIEYPEEDINPDDIPF